MATIRWQPERLPPPSPLPPLLTAVGRGLLNRCPVCGKAHVFNGYLRVVRECANCGTPLGLARADDAPPYFTILIVGHVMVPLMLWMDNSLSPSVWTLTAVFVPATIILSLLLLRPIKGGTVGLMLKLGLLKTDADE
jgi:uncharacterized protein (DUF983 family)